MPLYVLEYQFPEDSSRRLAARSRHRAYLAELKRQKKVIAAGPFSDGSGALIIYETADADELERLLARDPYGSAEVYGERIIREWGPFIGGRVPEA